MRRALAFLLISPLAACAAMEIGYTPPSKGGHTPEMMKPFHSGGLDSSGRYLVTEEERNLPCAKLTGSMEIIITRLKDNDTREPLSTAGKAVKIISDPLSGKGNRVNIDLSDEAKLARARLKAYNDLLAEKSCKTIDISGI